MFNNVRNPSFFLHYNEQSEKFAVAITNCCWWSKTYLLDNLNTWLEKILCYSGISLVAIVSLIATVFSNCWLSKASVSNDHYWLLNTDKHRLNAWAGRLPAHWQDQEDEVRGGDWERHPGRGHGDQNQSDLFSFTNDQNGLCSRRGLEWIFRIHEIKRQVQTVLKIFISWWVRVTDDDGFVIVQNLTLCFVDH